MARKPTHPTSSGSIPSSTTRLLQRKLKRKSSQPRVTNRWLIVAILIVFFAGTIWSGEAQNMLSKLYGGVAIVIVVFLMIEYVILKGRDRTRIYKLEVDNMRKKRRKDILFLRDIERELEVLESGLDAVGDRKCADIGRRVGALRRKINENL